MPAAERRQPHVAAADGDLHRHGARLLERVPEQVVHDRPADQAGRHDLPAAAAGVLFPNGVPNGTGRPGGCTRDIVHKFYQEQYQLNGGKQNRYMVGSDAIGTVMGVYDTKSLPIYQWLHGTHHPNYAIADNFFQAAFGGSFLNHQYLIAARAPEDANAPANLHSLVDAAGFPRNNYPLYTPVPGVDLPRQRLHVTCPSPVASLACGNWAVNTMQPAYEPSGLVRREARRADARDDRRPAVGEERQLGLVRRRLVERSGRRRQAGLDERQRADVLRPEPRPDVRRTRSAPTTSSSTTTSRSRTSRTTRRARPGRAHLHDEQEFIDTLAASKKAKDCQIPAVSFVKPLGEENEHPGYASEPHGSTHLIHLLQFIEGIACKKDTMVIVTYDEFGGEWDHVPPPGPGGRADGAARPVRPGHPDPGADLRAGPAVDLRRRQDRARHDVDPDDDRAPLRARPADRPRQGAERPVERLDGEGAELADW